MNKMIIFRDNYINVYSDNSFSLRDKSNYKYFVWCTDQEIYNTIFNLSFLTYNVKCYKCEIMIYNQNKKLVKKYKGIKYNTGRINIFTNTNYVYNSPGLYVYKSKKEIEHYILDEKTKLENLKNIIIFNGRDIRFPILKSMLKKIYPRLQILDIIYKSSFNENLKNSNLLYSLESFERELFLILMMICILILTNENVTKFFIRDIKDIISSILKQSERKYKFFEYMPLDNIYKLKFDLLDDNIYDDDTTYIKFMTEGSIKKMISYKKSFEIYNFKYIPNDIFKKILMYIKDNNCELIYNSENYYDIYGLCYKRKMVDMKYFINMLLTSEFNFKGDYMNLLVKLNEKYKIKKLNNTIEIYKSLGTC